MGKIDLKAGSANIDFFVIIKVKESQKVNDDDQEFGGRNRELP
ncbi:MAG: hypothetical protein XD63_0305 [Thermoanaerobacterales bacterium 50_218]|nr:MAG: hypothetical protein XD63_0305 [Thermoanaerobacterales bacterium 50_218]